MITSRASSRLQKASRETSETAFLADLDDGREVPRSGHPCEIVDQWTEKLRVEPVVLDAA
jgi:hypothetical protein